MYGLKRENYSKIQEKNILIIMFLKLKEFPLPATVSWSIYREKRICWERLRITDDCQSTLSTYRFPIMYEQLRARENLLSAGHPFEYEPVSQHVAPLQKFNTKNY